MELGDTSQVVSDPNAAERAEWKGLLFDGVTPISDRLWMLVYENSP